MSRDSQSAVGVALHAAAATVSGPHHTGHRRLKSPTCLLYHAHTLSLILSLYPSLSKLQLLPNESRSNANNKKKKKKVKEKAVEFVLKPKSRTQLMFSFNCTSGRETTRQP